MTTLDERLASALQGHYAIERELGHGGMAIVYLAEDRRHHRKVALKVLRPELASLVGRARFLREIEIEASLSHPGIIPLFDSGGTDEFVYYVMPCVEGESLREKLDKERQLPLEEALRIARDVGDALSYAHGRGVVHRDIKPANILLSGTRALVADFGIARAVTAAGGEQITSSGLAVGTPAYMSPEQAGGQDPVDQRTDEYALACVVYEMLAGQPPFVAVTAQAVLAQHRLERPPSLEIVRPGVGHVVQHVVEKALRKVPADRFQTVEEFVGALERAAVSPEPADGAPTSVARRTWWKAAGGVVGLLGLAWVATVVVPPLLPARLDDNKIVVFPLEERVDSALAGSGAGIAALISQSLALADPIKVDEGWVWLSPAQRHDATMVTADDLSRIARLQHARYALGGSVSRSGDSARVALRLLDVRGDSVLPQVSQAGLVSPTLIVDLARGAVVRLLSRVLAPGRRVDLSLLQDRDAAAVVAAVLGDLDYRDAKFDAALEHYRRSLELDSAMVFAAIKGASAANWDHRPDRALALARLAVRQAGRAPEKYRHFAVGLLAYLTDDPDSAAAAYRRALALDSTWTEAWMALGEVHYHFLVGGWNPDALAQVDFERARHLDPGFTPALYHLTEIELRRGWSARADSLYRAFRAAGPDGDWLHKATWAMRCVRDGPDAVDWARAAGSAGEASWDVITVGHGLAKAQPVCAERALRAGLYAAPPESLNNRWNALVGLQTMLVAQGRYGEVRRLLAWGVDSVHLATRTLQLVDAVLGVGTDSGAAAGLRDLGGDSADLRGKGPRWFWWHGIWAWHRHDATRLARIVAWAADTMRVGDATGTDTLVHNALAARLALLRADTARAMGLLSRLEPRGDMGDIGWQFLGPVPEERLLYAQLLLAKGRNAEALEVAGVFDSSQPMSYALYLPASLQVRLRAAERLGRRDIVSECRRRLAALSGGAGS